MSKSPPCRLRDGVRTMRPCEPAKPPAGIGNLLPKKICTTALAFVAVIACATSAPAQSPTTSYEAAVQSQNPLSPLYSLLNESSTNFNFGPLDRTQDVLLVEPVIPIRLTPNFNLVMRWITPLTRQPLLADPFGPFPELDRRPNSAISRRSSSLRQHMRETDLSGAWAPTLGFQPRPTRF